MGKYRIDSLFDTDKTKEKVYNHIIRVAFESAADMEFDYGLPDDFWPIQTGQRVEAPFGRKNKLETGFCVGFAEEAQRDKGTKAHRAAREFKLKTVEKVIDKTPLINDELMALARWISEYYVCPLGQVLAAIVPSAVKRAAGVKTQTLVYLNISPDNIEQTIGQLKGKKQKQIVQFLLQQKAFNKDSAVEIQVLMEQLRAGKESLRKLSEKQIIQTSQKTIIKSLPAIPQSLAIKQQGTIVLNDDQQKALDFIKSRINEEKFGVTVLYGVTDSGKTELYIRAIQEVLRKDRKAIVLLPEIALTTQTVQRFRDRFEKIAVMHSGLTSAQRNAQWQMIKSGQADVVIGARSAVFAPLARLGLIVVDEEHESSYKQDTAPRYNARDVAIKRVQSAGAHCILGSATPSLETICNCHHKKHFSLVRLPKRVMDLPMPEMLLVDMTKSRLEQKGFNLLSETLAGQLQITLERKEQAILLLNRRGYSNFIFCASCGHTLHCRNCDVTLTFHKSSSSRNEMINTVTGAHIKTGMAICHYCLAKTLVPEKCPVCSKGLAMIGMGSQRLEEEVSQKFPQAKICRIDSDSMLGRDYYGILNEFGRGQIDILAGTQILAKGLHFPNVTLVGVISADTCLYLPDFRSNERTFQLISQVAGRAGRSVKKGIVVVQSFLPGQQVIQYAIQGDFEGFTQEELKHRKSCNLPPYWRLAAVVLRDVNYEKLEATSGQMRQQIDRIVEREKLQVNIRGPMQATINRIQRFHRMQIIIQAPQAEIIQMLFSCIRAEKPVRPAVKIAIDIDPVNLL
jgi:primosomal protein N' (replication factor Y) (superfamily II helicase)